MPAEKVYVPVKGWRWGKSGHVYPISEFGDTGAKKKANVQGQAIHASENRQVKASGRAKGYQRSV